LTAHLEKLTANLKKAQERLKVAELRFREKERVRREVSEDAEGLKLLRSQQLTEHREESDRQQQITLDEIVMRKWSMSGADDAEMITGFPE
jgi:flagellar biosynthesis chaperone FliJ